MKVKVMQVGPIGTNCYILEDEGAKLAAVIDPGDEAEAIQEVVEGTGARVEYKVYVKRTDLERAKTVL